MLSEFSGSTYAVALACVHGKCASMFVLTFRSVHVAIENADASLTQGRNDVIWSAHLESPRDIGANVAAWVDIK